MSLDDVVSSTMRTNGRPTRFSAIPTSLVITSRTYTHGGAYGQFIRGQHARRVDLAYVPQIQARLISEPTLASRRERRQWHGSYDLSTPRPRGLSTQDFPVAIDQMQFPVAGAPLMTAELRVISGDARIVAYGSVIDNHSGDPIYVAAMVPRPGAFVAPVISQPGVNTFWRSDVFLSAPTDSGGTFDLTYVDAVTGERVVKHGSLAGHQAVRLDDVSDHFGRPVGSARPCRSPAPRRHLAHLHHIQNGMYGQFIPRLVSVTAPRERFPIERSAVPNERRRDQHRDGEIDLFYALRCWRPRARQHRPDLGPLRPPVSLDSLTASPVVNGRVNRGLSGGLWYLASVVDNVSGDPIFIVAQY
jgi:hypothetical protein